MNIAFDVEIYSKIFNICVIRVSEEDNKLCVCIEGKEEEKIMTKNFPILSNKHKSIDHWSLKDFII